MSLFIVYCIRNHNIREAGKRTKHFFKPRCTTLWKRRYAIVFFAMGATKEGTDLRAYFSIIAYRLLILLIGHSGFSFVINFYKAHIAFEQLFQDYNSF